MSTEKVAVHEMVTRMGLEARRLGFSETFIWCDFIPRLRKFAIFYDRHGYVWYDPAITQQVVDEHAKRFEEGTLGADAFSRVRTYARRMNEFYLRDKLGKQCQNIHPEFQRRLLGIPKPFEIALRAAACFSETLKMPWAVSPQNQIPFMNDKQKSPEGEHRHLRYSPSGLHT